MLYPFATLMFLAALGAFPLSLFLLRRYKRAVLRSMNNPATIVASTGGLTTRTRNVAQSNAQLPRLLLRLPQHAALIYAAAGFAYALVTTFGWVISIDAPILSKAVLVSVWSRSWPIVWSTILVAGSSRRSKAIIIVTYFSILLCGTALGFSLRQLAVLWIFPNLTATVFLMFFVARPIRAVGPIVFAFMIIALTGSFMALVLTNFEEGGLVVSVARAFGLAGVRSVAFVAITGLLVFAVLGWFVMHWIGRRYERKKLTDQSITIESIWFVFASVHCIQFYSNGAGWALVVVPAFGLYKIILAAGFWLWKPEQAAGPSLLILRVFSLGRRSQRMFNAVAQQWRYVGSIQLLAGPDLATTTVEPHEFLAFLGGKLARRFIVGADTFEQRLKEMDLTRDFDHRFRVNDFFCNENAWRMVLSHLIQLNDAVLMDLRGFTRANGGCAFELQELVRLAEPRRVVLVVDDTTDTTFLDETLGPGAQRFTRVQASSRRGEVRRTIDAICGAANAGAVTA